MSRLAVLKARQAAEVKRLETELADLVTNGNEYHAAMVRDELIAARSLARLVHKAITVIVA